MYFKLYVFGQLKKYSWVLEPERPQLIFFLEISIQNGKYNIIYYTNHATKINGALNCKDDSSSDRGVDIPSELTSYEVRPVFGKEIG